MSVTKGGEERKNVKYTNTQEKCDFQLKNLCLQGFGSCKDSPVYPPETQGKREERE
jgi:hypothetical protein